jgi:hypothetical protein
MLSSTSALRQSAGVAESIMSDEPLPKSEIILYQTEDGGTRVQVQFKGETAWLSLNQMAELFQRNKSVISKHIKNTFDEGELNPAATVAKYATVQIWRMSRRTSSWLPAMKTSKE